MSTAQHSGFNTINCGSEKSHGKEREKENEKEEWKKETEKEGGREEEGRQSNAEKLLILYPFLSL